jgi:hypothetical protein
METTLALNLAAGVEPLAGYPLVRLFGRGWFGEVWETLAPGGFRLALKFICLDAAEAARERRALAVIRNIRHPHLLDAQFAALVDDYAVLTTLLCDRTLLDRFHECRSATSHPARKVTPSTPLCTEWCGLMSLAFWTLSSRHRWLLSHDRNWLRFRNRSRRVCFALACRSRVVPL